MDILSKREYMKIIKRKIILKGKLMYIFWEIKKNLR